MKKNRINTDHLNGAADILESISDGFFALDRDWRFIYINQRAASNLGMTPEELTGKTFWEKFPKNLILDHEIYIRRAMEQGQPQEFDSLDILTDKCYHARIYPFASKIMVYWQDITERKQIEGKLVQSQKILVEANKLLKQFGERIVQVREEERKQTACELYDETAQYLGILKMQIGALADSEEIQSPKIKEKMRLLEKDANRAFNDLSRYSHELWPAMQEHRSLHRVGTGS
jgi:signal transduction histidine kinase